MASELKPCPLCSADPSSKFTDIKAAIWCEPCGLHMEYSTAMVSLRIAEEHQRSILTKRWNTRPTPVAPVSPDADGKCRELETVMRRYRGTDWPEHYPWAYLNESECQGEAGPRWIIEELCLRSQAVELLAAERAEKEIAERNRDAARENFLTMQKSAAKLLERAEKAEADNAALTARVKELRIDRAAWEAVATDIRKQAKALEAKLTAAEKALTEIASFTQTTDLLWWQERARAALGGKP